MKELDNNPFFAVFRTILRLKRTCPKCGRNQAVKPSKKTEAVPCKYCTTSIPPPR